MGKSKAFKFSDTPDYNERTISRSMLRTAVEAGIRAVPAEQRGEIYEEEVRRMAETTDTIDAYTWRCRNSCGCPMTKVGAALPAPDALSGSAPSAAGAFAGAFDSKIVGMLGSVGRALKLTVVSDEEYAARGLGSQVLA